ncbi:MAG: hypothetical protein ACK4VS_08030 [Burkholderiales bacterium]|jgi:hypothetical protein|nr:hypothetical protein [Burkholderiales bacterium]MCA3165036.1 hypothetical protein [Burkholderiales bacterium]MCA3169708.1 hypothetical protein [Burkholderiales bacterium]
MSRLQPKPAVFFPPSQAINLNQALSLPQVLSMHALNNERFERIGLAHINKENYYRVVVSKNQPARYFSTLDGRELSDGDRLYAQELARHYTGKLTEPIVSARYITSFGDDYHPVNRLLPVWRVEFASEGQLRAFVDTDQARLATLVDNTRQLLTQIFRWGHNWEFLSGHPKLQIFVMTLLLVLGLFSAVSGIYFYFRMRKTAKQRLHKKPLARWHRTVAIAVSFSTLTFVSSGIFHLWITYWREANSVVSAPSNFDLKTMNEEIWKKTIANFNNQPLSRLNALSVGNEHFLWLADIAKSNMHSGPRAQVAALSNDEHAEHKKQKTAPPHPMHPSTLVVDATTGEKWSGDVKTVATLLAKQYADPSNSVVQTEFIQKFSGEYGFINKRLPVVKVQFSGPGNPRYYIEPVTGVLAAKVDDLDALEGKSFAYLHKWHFTDGGKDLRDFLLALFAFLNVVIAVAGVALYVKRLKKQP